ncbi:nuclear RNA export factor 1-like isoform X3 [Petromyzon marinus]
MSICKALRQQLLVAKRRIFKADSAVPSQLCWFEISECLSQKYDPTNKALDLKAVRINEELEARGVDLVLNRKDHMDGLNKIIRENIPMITSLNLTCNDLHRLDDLAKLAQHTPSLKKLNLSKNNLKDVRELYPLKAFNLKELWLKGNPLCDSFHDPNADISFVRKHFPQLVILDGQMLSQLRSSTPAVPSTPVVVHRIAENSWQFQQCANTLMELNDSTGGVRTVSRRPPQIAGDLGTRSPTNPFLHNPCTL